MAGVLIRGNMVIMSIFKIKTSEHLVRHLDSTSMYTCIENVTHQNNPKTYKAVFLQEFND